MLASEGRPIPQEAIAFAARLAKSLGASVQVLSIARVYGTSLGLPNPGLRPNKREWEQQREYVTAAVKELRKRGVRARGRSIGARAAAKHIVRTAEREYCGAIVMAADRPRNWFVADFMWSQEPYRVRQRSRLPVYLVVPEEARGGQVRGREEEARGA
jgi:nucleotide-binding universal stress UspA family protein